MSNRTVIRIPLLAGYAIAAVSVAFAVDWQDSDRVRSLLFNLGKTAGLAAFVMLTFQVVLTCRLKILDRIFAIDTITNFHKLMGMTIGCLLLAHITLMMLGVNSAALLAVDTSWRVNLGKAALSLALITVITAAAFEAFAIDYNIWRVGHKTALAIVLLAFLHSWFIGHDIHHGPLRFIWAALLLMAAAAAAYRNLWIPLAERKRYTIQSVDKETHNTYTLTLAAAETPIQPHKPGQFMFLKLKRPGRTSELHPFTIAAPPTAGHLQATIKQSGNFTDTIDRTETSDTAYVEGPYGQFSFLNYADSPLLLIAGGVGITPIMSMIRYLRDTQDTRRVVLLYGSNTPRDIIFREELDTLADPFSIVHVVRKAEEDWTGLKGFITQNVIREHAQTVLENAEVFVCGPPPMMSKIIAYLKQLGVPGARIHYERFSI